MPGIVVSAGALGKSAVFAGCSRARKKRHSLVARRMRDALVLGDDLRKDLFVAIHQHEAPLQLLHLELLASLPRRRIVAGVRFVADDVLLAVDRKSDVVDRTAIVDRNSTFPI